MVDYLERAGLSCFIAPRDIEGGKPYGLCLIENIKECKIMVVIASANINGSEHIMNEIDIAVDNDKPIIPFFIEDFDMKDEMRYYLGRKQRIIATSGNIEEYYDNLLSAIATVIPEALNIKRNAPKDTMRVFEYIADRGIMINPVDHHRNVSFRSDTYVKFCSGMYDAMSKMAGKEVADKAFFDSGYESGGSFGRRINDQLNSNIIPMSTEEKINRWCEFDSSVGWGKFTNNLTIDKEAGDIKGTIDISECFIVDKIGNRKICEFIKGYCNGVLEQIINGVPVNLECVSCPLTNKFKTECKFKVTVKE